MASYLSEVHTPSLPPVTTVERIEVRPGDVIHVEFERRLTPEELNRAKTWLKGEFPEAKVVITDPGVRLRVLAPEVESPISER